MYSCSGQMRGDLRWGNMYHQYEHHGGVELISV